MFNGSIVALVTPWKDDRVDFDALERMIEFQIVNGTQGLLPCGTTGESPAFSHEEQHEMIRRTVAFAAGRVPVMAGAGSNCTTEAVSLARAAEDAGADGVLTITPYYNKPNQEGLFQHFKAVREACGLPLVLYNVPGRTGCNLLPETAERVAALGNVDAVKEASGDIQQSWELMQRGVRVLSGEDALTFPLMCMGASGVVSVIANFAPRLVADLCAAVLAQDLEEARRLQVIVAELTTAAFSDTNPLPTKAALAAMGFCREEFRLPLLPMADDKRIAALAVLRQHGVVKT